MNDNSNQDGFLDDKTETDKNDDFLVVGIGASAGGINALKDFFRNVPADSGMAYVVILHLSPDHDSQLAEVLQQSSQIPADFGENHCLPSMTRINSHSGRIAGSAAG